ncbi:MAG TPA: type II toxin-antitoxin system RelE/ParE family toxin [Spirochaetota bacterium]|nr:type II toxin-antitoxin system RelE/ParE family toxin [Spirochaetota bacterium]
MNYRISWTRYAQQSLNEILDYIIEHDGKIIAHKIYQKIRDKTSLLKVSPLQGREVKELKSLKKKYREIIITPWRIIYTVENEVVNVLLIIDGRRDLEELLYEMIINSDSA